MRAGSLTGFNKWLQVPDDSDLHVAAFYNGLSLTHGFHTLSTGSTVLDYVANNNRANFYTVYVYGHGPAGTHTSYAYLAGHDSKIALFVTGYEIIER